MRDLEVRLFLKPDLRRWAASCGCLVARYKNVMAPAKTHSTFSTTKNFLPFVERMCSTNPSAFED